MLYEFSITSVASERVVSNGGKQAAEPEMSVDAFSFSLSPAFVRVVQTGTHSLPPVTPRSALGALKV